LRFSVPNARKTDYYNEFQKYAMGHLGVSTAQWAQWENTQNTLYSKSMVQASMTPYILEERELRVTQMDIFSRLMMDRILWLAGPVNDMMSTVVSAQLLFLSSVDATKDITMYVDTPGGSVKAGLTIVDTMELIKPDIATINTGMAASMGSILLGAGTKGKRSSLRHSRVMLHQVSYGASGNVQDIEITRAEAMKTNDELFDLLGEYCGKTPKEVLKDATRDFWLSAKEAVEYGIIDNVVKRSA
jgi:ATP-dependent Clp protease protease subunit